MHPVGLYFLISLLKHNGFEVHFFNCLERSPASKSKRFSTGNFECREFPKPEIYRLILRHYKLYGQSQEAFASFLSSLRPPEVIFIGSQMTYWLPGLIETVRFVKGYFPLIPMVIGGISAKLIPGNISAALPGAHIFQGSLFEQSSMNASGIPTLSGLCSKNWEPSLIDAYKCFSFAFHGPVLSSLGCPGRCSYCASAVLQERFVIRKADTIADEIEYLRGRFNVGHFAFVDDALLHSPEQNFILLMKTLLRRRLNFRFHTPNGLQVTQLSPEICALMKETGFRTLRFGYESSDFRYLRDTKAKASRNDLALKIKLVKEYGFSGGDVGVYVMAGFPGQSPDDVTREIEFVASLAVSIKPVFLSPVPQTKLFEHYRTDFPELAIDPLWHNDTFFISRLPGWNATAVQQVIDAAKKNNAQLDTKQ